MNIKLVREDFTEESTIGEMFVNGVFNCYTLEDKVRETEPKVYGKTAIPYGHYNVVINWSNRFQKYMPLLLNVPDFEGIRIHPLNKASETEGCIGVGMVRGKNFIGQSRVAYNNLMKILRVVEKKEKIFIEITKKGE
jgi:hypothetical protein